MKTISKCFSLIQIIQSTVCKEVQFYLHILERGTWGVFAGEQILLLFAYGLLEILLPNISSPFAHHSLNPDYQTKILRWVKSFAIFWSCEAQFSNSEYFHKGREDDELHWTTRCWTHLMLSECYLLDLQIYAFRSSSSCLIIKVLATQARFLELSDYCIVINHAFIFLVASAALWPNLNK